MIIRKIKTSLPLYTFLISFIYQNYFSVLAEEIDIEPVHYAYSNYLGSGIYKTANQNVTLINLPFSYELGRNDKTSYGLRLPLSLGFFDFSFDDVPDLDFPDEVGTVTFTPGISFDYQATDNLIISSYIDVGYAKNLTTDRDVIVHSAGISSLYHFTYKALDSIWTSRLYYAEYDGRNYSANDQYAAFQMGIDTGLPLKYRFLNYSFQPRLFASVFWYFSEVDFKLPVTTLSTDKQKVTLTNSVEVGFTLKFDQVIGYSWAGIERIGISYRHSNNIDAVRLLFSFPI